MSKFWPASEHCTSLEKFYLKYSRRTSTYRWGLRLRLAVSDLDKYIPLMLPLSWSQTCGGWFNAPVLAQPDNNQVKFLAVFCRVLDKAFSGTGMPRSPWIHKLSANLLSAACPVILVFNEDVMQYWSQYQSLCCTT